MDTNRTTQYHLYIDECGDQNLETFSPTFPIFTLCGILVRDDKVSLLEEQIRALKKEFWGDRQIILHSRDIRKCQNGFEILFDLDVKHHFYEAVNRLLGQKDIYVIVSCSILKEPYIRQFGKLNDVYGQSLSFVIERAIFVSITNGKMETEESPPLLNAEASVRTKIFRTTTNSYWRKEHIG